MNRKWGFWLGLFAFTFVWRILPYALEAADVMKIDPQTTWYPWNFAPFMAVCLFSGAGLPDRRWAFTAPLVVFALSNFAMWGLTGHRGFAFSPSQPLIMAAFAGTVAIGQFLKSSPRWSVAIPAGVVAETLFFIITNFAVWYFGEGGIYPLTMQGLVMCYVAAIPYFGRSLVSTTLFASILFSPVGLRLVGMQPVSQRRPVTEPVVAGT